MSELPPQVSEGEQQRLTAEEVRRVAALCRLGLTGEEIERLRGEMASLLAEVSILQAIDTGDAEATGHAVEGVHTVMRDDEPRQPLPIEDVLLNAPRTEGVYIRVPAVME
ncbi:MAG: Asp-tRNA(Asn)/Glu-tRNA(Gln) amidotransferase subunit GatC [Dehalococcoidia bacterium]